MTVPQLKQAYKERHLRGYSDLLKPALRMKLLAASRGQTTLGKYRLPGNKVRLETTETSGAVRHKPGGEDKVGSTDSAALGASKVEPDMNGGMKCLSLILSLIHI